MSTEMQRTEKGMPLTEIPVIYIGAGTCGLGAGATALMAGVKKYLDENSIHARVVEVGCIGLCSSEPLMDVRLPGYSRVSFEKVTPSKVKEILDDIFTLHIPASGVLGQFREPGLKQWDGVRYFDEIPFFAPQQRLVLKNCGIIDPVNMHEYIASGGYAALTSCLENHTPVEVCEQIRSEE